jgi:glycosyltransferase involved in cell wall biosynthesis
MKVLVIAADAYPQTGGVEKHIKMVSTGVKKLGHTVDVVFLSRSTMKPFVQNGVKYLPFKALFGNTHLFSLAYISYVLRNAHKYDILHFQGLHKPLPVFMLSLLLKTKQPKVFTTHYHGGGHSLIANMGHIIYTPIVYPILSQLDGVIAVSEFEKNVLQVSFPQLHSKIKVIHNGVDSNVCVKKTKDKQDAISIIIVSRLERYKNIHKVLPQLPAGSVVHIVGDGGYRKNLQELSSGLKKMEIIFHGRVSDDELCKLWDKSDIHINMSSKEAYGLTVVESLIHETPVVCSNIPAFFEVKKITKSKNVHLINNVRDLSKLIKRVHSKGFQSDNMVIPTWDENSIATVKFYENLKGETNG